MSNEIAGRTTSPMTYAQAEALVLASEAKSGNPRFSEPLTLNGSPRPDYAWSKAFAIYGAGDDPEQPPAASQPAFIQFPVSGFGPEWALDDLLVGNPNLTYELVGDFVPAWSRLEALPNLVAAWDPERGIGTAGIAPAVSDWTDITGQYVVSQPVGSQQPAYTTQSNTPGQRASVRFARAAGQFLWGEYAALGSLFSADRFAFYVAGRQIGPSGTHVLCGAFDPASSAARAHMFVTPTAGHLGCSRGNSLGAVAQFLAQDFTVGQVGWAYTDVRASNDVALQHRGNATPEVNTSDVPHAGDNLSRFQMGASFINGAVGGFADMEALACLVFDTATEPVDHATVQSALTQLVMFSEGTP